MKKFIFVLISIWTTISVFSSNDFTPSENQPETIYPFEPDLESPSVEVAPLEVNKEDEDVPNQLTPSSNQNTQQNRQKPTLLPIQPIFSLPEEQ